MKRSVYCQYGYYSIKFRVPLVFFDEEAMLETLNYTILIGSTSTILYA